MSVNSVRAKWKGWMRADFTSFATGGEMKVYGICFPDASPNLEIEADAEVEAGPKVEKAGEVHNRSMRCSSDELLPIPGTVSVISFDLYWFAAVTLQ